MSKDPAAHALAFRVMRLCRPALQADLPLRCSAHDLWLGEDDPPLASSAPPPPDDAVSTAASGLGGSGLGGTAGARASAGDGGPGRGLGVVGAATAAADSDKYFASRVELRSPLDALGLSGMLVLPQSFGSIHLGETFCSYISVGNHSDRHVSNVVIKAELQTERHRVVLADNTSSPLERIQAGGRHDFIIEHDIKELGSHTLVCSAHYIDFGEHKVLPQYFKFMAANPLSVKTKVRTIRESTFLEACIENGSKASLFLDQVRFEPTPAWQVSQLEPEFTGKEEEEEEDAEEGAREEWGGAAVADEADDTLAGVAWSEVRALFKPVDLIRANGGTRHFLYHLHRTPPPPAGAGGGGAGESGGGGGAKVEGGNTLGRLEILWRSTLGEPGRLQTQQILGNPIARKEVELKLVSLPNRIVLERPFLVHCRVHNNSDRPLGPLRIVIARDEPVTGSTPRAIVVSGPWTMTIVSIASNSSADFNLSMVALASGVHKISGVGVVDARDSKPYDALTPTEVYVELQ
ncbi:hypothetical protein CLOM_g7500 [Closterium sp. NIES-68]|nr:hypothetical protein CLOM_g7500 [Closterium sp. NIES-68]GJP80389.1 hypothetical protein CLOP_g10601 [Closterium sp. NIES-67]